MDVKTNGWRAMSLAGGVHLRAPDKTITVTGDGSELRIKGGQIAIAAEGRTKLAINVLDGGYASTWNTQDAGVYTTGQATYNVDGPSSSLEIVRTGVPEDPASRDTTSIYGAIHHTLPLVGPLTINVTNRANMSVANSFGSRAAITAQAGGIRTNAINVSGPQSTLSVVNNSEKNSTLNDTTLYPVGAIAFAANCSGNINISDSGNFYAESYSPDSPTIALGGAAAIGSTGILTLDGAGTVDIKNNASTTNARAIALRGRNYVTGSSNDKSPTLEAKSGIGGGGGQLVVWGVGLGPDGWPSSLAVERWHDASFTAANSAPSEIAPGSDNGITVFTLPKYGRIYNVSMAPLPVLS